VPLKDVYIAKLVLTCPVRSGDSKVQQIIVSSTRPPRLVRMFIFATLRISKLPATKYYNRHVNSG